MGKKRGKISGKTASTTMVQGKKGKKATKPLDTDEFLSKGLDTDSEEETVEKGRESDEEPSQEKGTEISKHKKSLEKLKDQDPEFYEFLKKEDSELLDFNDSSGDEGDEEEDDEDDEEEVEEEDGEGEKKKVRVHKLPQKLEVASDDSEAETSDDEDETKEQSNKKKEVRNAVVITPKMIKEWSTALREHTSVAAMNNVVSAFKAALNETGTEEVVEGSKFKVEGSTMFNAVVRLCLTDLLPAFNRFLNLPKQKDPDKPVLPSHSPKWKKIKTLVKFYLTDLLQLTGQIGDVSILNVLLKHINQLSGFYVSLPKLARSLLKKLIVLWGTSEETCRVLAFLTINKVTRYMQSKMLEFVIKQMYLEYVKNCKFTSPTSLPMINFMQRSLVEMMAIDVQLTYQYAFVYVRQLAIHLRNAITAKKKENSQAVYNWQYIHCLHLWTRVLSHLHPNDVLEPLIYPLTQVIMGTIKLIPTARYYPLRFHCVRSLNMLSEHTNTFIPVLPFLLEIFQLTDFNKKHKNISFKPMNFAVILKLSNAQLQEKSFRDGVIDQLYELLLDHLNIHAHTVSFPELTLPAIVQLKQFNKQCKVSNYTKQMKQILEKVEANSAVITQRRKTATFNLADTKGVLAWEKRSKEEGTPLTKYYSTWRKLRDREIQHEIAGKERISTDDLPVVERRPKYEPKKATEEERKEFADLFDTDSEDENDETRFLPKEERPKKKQKTNVGHDDDDSTGNYSDFDSDELEELDRSADEEDEDEEDEDEDDDDDEEEDESEEEEDLKSSKKHKAKNGKQKPNLAMDDIEDGGDVVKDFSWSDEDDSS